MSVKIASIDYTRLPQQLLPHAKMHCRVSHDDDDVFMVSVITKAIHHFEIKTETKVFEAEYRWTPVAMPVAQPAWPTFPPAIPPLPVLPTLPPIAPSGTAQCPISPVRSFKVWAAGFDVSSVYRLETDSVLDGTGTYYLSGPAQPGAEVRIFTGYENASLIPPGVLDRIMHLTATYWENRELFIPSGQFLNPLSAGQDLAGWWVPRA